MRSVVAVFVSFGLLAPGASARPLDAPVAHASATCADYSNQAAAQRAADTRDGDGDGIYGESLPAQGPSRATCRTSSPPPWWVPPRTRSPISPPSCPSSRSLAPSSTPTRYLRVAVSSPRSS
jgi:hypothetical protein